MKRCWHCGVFTPFVCDRCDKPLCVVMYSPVPATGCGRLRRLPGHKARFQLICSPRCVARRSPDQIARLKGLGP